MSKMNFIELQSAYHYAYNEAENYKGQVVLATHQEPEDTKAIEELEKLQEWWASTSDTLKSQLQARILDQLGED